MLPDYRLVREIYRHLEEGIFHQHNEVGQHSKTDWEAPS